jgi:acyl-CoA thioester hydrolase
MGEPVEVWRGGVASWECDSMDHLNIGFYLAKAMDGLVGLGAELGMPRAFAPQAESTLIVREQHVRFLREARVAAPLHITAGVLEMAETEARVLLLMHHADGAPAASFQMLVAHATSREGRPFPWPERVRARAERLRIDLPQAATPRSIPLGPLESAASRARARKLGLTRVGLGAVRPGDVDPFGRMKPEAFMARLSEDPGHLIGPISAEVRRLRGRATGGVQLEYRLIYLNSPRIGDRIELWAGVADPQPRTQRKVFWLLDPDSDRVWAAAEGIETAFDMETRTSALLSEAELAPWRQATIPGLSI